MTTVCRGPTTMQVQDAVLPGADEFLAIHQQDVPGRAVDEAQFGTLPDSETSEMRAAPASSASSRVR